MSPIISLKVNEELHERFEKVRIASGFDSKSEALRESIVKFIETHNKFDDLEGYKIMTVNLVYPFKDSIIDEITEIYSHYHNVIRNVSDWRIAEKKIEILLAVGEIQIIKDLYRKISSIKDVIASIHEIIIE